MKFLSKKLLYLISGTVIALTPILSTERANSTSQIIPHNSTTSDTGYSKDNRSSEIAFFPRQPKERFYCDETEIVTKMRNLRGDRELRLMGYSDSGFPLPWTPLKRCQDVTARLNRFHNNRLLTFIKASTNNQYNQPVICVSAYERGDCIDVVVTLKPDKDPEKVLKRIINQETLSRTGKPVVVNGKKGEDFYINMEAFIEKFDREK